MRDLIARIEAATGPDRELDGLVHMATRPDGMRLPPSWMVLRDTGQIYAWNCPPPHARGTGGVWCRSPAYTASLDAAVSLVPADHMLQLIGVNDSWDVRLNPTCDHGGRAIPQFFGRSLTPALALCAAALRARLAMQEASDAS